MISESITQPDQADLTHLEQRCRQETQRYRGGQPSDERYCLEIFRRALERADHAHGRYHDEAARDLLVRLYGEYIKAQLSRRARRLAALEDLIQQVWMRFWGAANNGLDFASLDRALAYLRRITVSVVIEAQREHYTQARERSLSLISEEIGPGTANSDLFATHAQSRFYTRCTELLADPLERRVFWMRYSFGLAPREIAARLAAEGRQVGRREASARAVSDLLERVCTRLSADPEIHDLLRSD